MDHPYLYQRHFLQVAHHLMDILIHMQLSIHLPRLALKFQM
jgi:hypothetical protein